MIIFHYGIITFQRVHLDTVLDMKKTVFRTSFIFLDHYLPIFEDPILWLVSVERDCECTPQQ